MMKEPSKWSVVVINRYTRSLSFNERLYLCLDEICPPLCNQLFFEGSGSLDYAKWCKAVEIASEANPGSRLVLEGYLGSSRWVDSGLTPRVREVDGSTWDGYGPEGAPFLMERLLYHEGPTCEVILIRGSKPRVAFRTHHGVMDGRGTMTWIEDIFRALNGLDVLGAPLTLNDYQLARSFQKQKCESYPVEHIAPTGRAIGNERGMIWKRIIIEGRYHNILGRCAKLIAREAWKHSPGGVVRIGIPVDMRPRLGGQRSTANLVLPVIVEVKPETTPEQIADDIAFQIKHGYEGMLSPGDDLHRYVPVRLLASLARKIIDVRHSRGLYSLSGYLTHMGHIPVDNFRGGGFQATAFWGIPPGEYYPFFLGMASYGNTQAFCLTMPKVLASEGRMDEILNNILQGLQNDT